MIWFASLAAIAISGWAVLACNSLAERTERELAQLRATIDDHTRSPKHTSPPPKRSTRK